MYEEHFGFSGPPFRLNPDPKFFFGSRSHNKAMSYLHYGLRQGEGFIVITGEIGAGKSMLIGHLIDQLDRSNVVAANLLTTNVEADALLSHILSAFRIEPAGAGKSAELDAFEDFLYDQMNRGRRVLLIVDEAQNLPFRTIEELRMLSNMDYEGTPLFQVFLVGQPEFRSLLAKPDMEQFRQRVIASYHLEPLGPQETREYIEHRLSLVGWSNRPSFSANAFKEIFDATGGVPRKINRLANRILLHCSLENIDVVTPEVVTAVYTELKGESLEKPIAAAATDRLTDPADARSPATSAPAVAQSAPADDSAVEEMLGMSIDDPKVKPARDVEPVPVPLEAVRAISPEPQLSGGEGQRQPEREAATRAPERSVMDAVLPQGANGAARGSSALDRLREMRASRRIAGAATEREAATLVDVRRAIEAATVDGEAFAAEEEGGALAPIASHEIDAWRLSVIKSIDDTRFELKTAYANVSKLKARFGEIEARRRERREKIADGLARAEALLSELRAGPH
jgi:putative secretion ATPase (PEP-CTERM system associated)